MTFLNPALLIGLLAAGIPVLIHFLNLRKLKRVEFSTLLFLKELQKQKIRRLKLKQWILLAVRVLIIIALVLAFSRPSVQNVSFAGVGSTAKTSAVIIIDNTFSMSLLDDKGSYFNRAKKAASEIIASLREGDEVAVIFVNEESTPEPVSTKDFTGAIDKIEKTGITGVSKTLNESVIKAANLLSETYNFNKELFILSDFQKSRLGNTKDFANLSELLDSRTKLFMMKFDEKKGSNLAVTNLEVKSAIFEKDKPVSVQVTIEDFTGGGSSNETVSLFVNGERTAQKSFNISGGVATVDLEGVIKSSGFVEITATIEEDDILPDNKRFAVVYVPEVIKAAMFFEKEEEILFLTSAIKAGEEKTKINLISASVNSVTNYNLSNYDLVIVSGTVDNTAGAVFKNYVENGGKLAWFPPTSGNITQANNFLNQLLLPQFKSVFGRISGTDEVARFSTLNLESPLLSGVFKSDKRGNPESPSINFGYEFSSGGRGAEIIRLTNNSTFLGEFTLGEGKVLVYSVPPVLQASDFPVKGIFVPLIFRTVLYLSGMSGNIDGIQAGERVTLSKGMFLSSNVRITGPEGFEEIKNLENNINLIFTKTLTNGIYSFSSAGVVQRKIPVNTNPEESDLQNMSNQDIEDYTKQSEIRSEIHEISPSSDYIAELERLRFGSEFWKPLIFIAIGLIILEMLLFRSSKKDVIKSDV